MTKILEATFFNADDGDRGFRSTTDFELNVYLGEGVKIGMSSIKHRIGEPPFSVLDGKGGYFYNHAVARLNPSDAATLGEALLKASEVCYQETFPHLMNKGIPQSVEEAVQAFAMFYLADQEGRAAQLGAEVVCQDGIVYISYEKDGVEETCEMRITQKMVDSDNVADLRRLVYAAVSNAMGW